MSWIGCRKMAAIASGSSMPTTAIRCLARLFKVEPGVPFAQGTISVRSDKRDRTELSASLLP